MTYTKLDEIKRRHAAATPGPWKWVIGLAGKVCRLESQGRGAWLEIVIDFVRWGMGGAKPRFLDQEKHLMVPADQLTEKVPGREHHEEWHRTIKHPDADFIAHSWEDVKELIKAYEDMEDELDELRRELRPWPPIPRREFKAQESAEWVRFVSPWWKPGSQSARNYLTSREAHRWACQVMVNMAGERHDREKDPKRRLKWHEFIMMAKDLKAEIERGRCISADEDYGHNFNT